MKTKFFKRLVMLVFCVMVTFSLLACGDNTGLPNPNDNHTHEYTWTVKEAPTCTEDGVKLGTCECGETTTEKGEPAKGHTEVDDAAVAPTCTEAGKTAGKHCSVCETITVAQDVVPAKGHEDTES